MCLDLPCQLVIGQVLWGTFVKLCVRLEGQLVVRDMRRRQATHRGNVGGRRCKVLSRKGEHEIDIDAPETGGGRVVERGDNILRPVDAAEHHEHPGVETLGTYRYAIYARGAEAREISALEGAGIDLHRYFAVVGKPEFDARGLEDSFDVRRAKEARGAATQVDTLYCAFFGAPGFRREIGEYCGYVLLERRLVTGSMRVEVAIRALANTPGQVDIQA